MLNNDLRHPVLVAREAATVDLLADGRLQLGLGAGYMRSEYEQAGISYDPGRTRVERLAEAVAIIKLLLAGETVSLAGRHYRVTDHAIGGNGPQLLTLAAREADIVGLTGITFSRGGTEPDLAGCRADAVDERVRLIKDAAGIRREQVELNALVQRVLVTDDRRHAAAELAEGRWSQLSPDEILESPYVLIGTVDQMVEDLKARRARWGIFNYAIHEPYLDALAPVVERLAGA